MNRSRESVQISAQDVKAYTLEHYLDLVEDSKINKRCYFTLDNLIIDATNYANSIAHPGGRQIIKFTSGRDIGKFLNGSTSVICNQSKYQYQCQHTLEAYSQVKKLTIGKLNVNQYLLAHSNIYKREFQGEEISLEKGQMQTSTIHEKIQMLFPFEVDETTVSQDWVYVGKADIFKNINRYSFANSSIFCVNEFKKIGGVKWLNDVGKDIKFIVSDHQLKRIVPNHFRQKRYNKECERYYTVVRALTAQNLRILNKKLQPYDNFKQLHNQPSLVAQQRGQTPNYTFVDVYAKVYGNGLFSKYLDSMQPNSSIKMSGPTSNGLRLTRLFLESNPKIVCLSGGTAITLFLDLVYYVYASCHQAFEEWEVPYKIDLTLFAAFGAEEEAIGLNFLESAAREARRFNLHLYFTSRASQLEQDNCQRFTSNFIRNAIGDVQSVDRWYFEGPSRFESEVGQALERLGVGHKVIRT